MRRDSNHHVALIWNYVLIAREGSRKINATRVSQKVNVENNREKTRG